MRVAVLEKWRISTMKKARWLFVLLLVFALVAAACSSDDSDDTTTTAADSGGETETTAAGETTTTAAGDTTETTAADADMVDVAGTDFTLVGLPVGDEGKALEGFLNVYNAEKGTNITFTGSDDMESQVRIRVEGGDPPEMFALAQPGSICPWADDGVLASLEDMDFDIAQLEDQFGKFWMDLGLCDDGKHYGVPWFPNYKSIVFYHEPTFVAQGYAIPETWDEMMALSQQMVDDGFTPWCFGFESGGATGWAGTDWIEDIVARQSGPDVYAQWFKHEIPFNDPAVVAAFDTFGELIFSEGFVLGGAENIAGVNTNDSPGPLFDDPPGCLMLKQGTFARNWMVDLANYTPETAAELKVFAFPSIDGNQGAMGGGDTLIVFNGTPENAQLIKDWITPDWQCTLASFDGGGISPYGGHGVEGVERLPANRFTDVNCLNTEENQFIAQVVWEAMGENVFVFDGGDLMPPAVGQGSFWTGMVDFTRGTSSQAVTDAVEASWP
jgi:alpha-glucoside transport system substrate-binding protein